MNRAGGGQQATGRSVPRGLESSLGREFELFFWAANQLSSAEKNCTAYSLFCIFIIMIVTTIISSSISISFVALLNRLALNAQVSPCLHLSSPSRGGEAERGASGCLLLSSRLPG